MSCPRAAWPRTVPVHIPTDGAEFFSPAHWPLFVQFVRALECPEEAHEDDLPGSADGGARLTVPSAAAAAPRGEATREVQIQTV